MQATKFDLSRELALAGGRVSGSLEYTAALFDHQTADGMARQFEQLLRSTVYAPTSSVHELSMLTAEDRPRLSPLYEEGEL